MFGGTQVKRLTTKKSGKDTLPMDTIATPDPIKALSVTSYGQSSFAAFRHGSQLLATAYNEFSDVVAEAVRSHFDQTVSTYQAIAKAESVKDAMTIQTNFMRQYTQAAFIRSNELVQASHRLAHVAVTSMTVKPNDAGGANA